MADRDDARPVRRPDDPAPVVHKGDDVGQAEVQEKFDKEQAQGYRGVVPDATPNEAYTVQGVAKGMPTPETERRHPERTQD